ncbi:MAG: ROK family protein [Elusimicrobiaceae bacterium]|nr:ROK family protein [Elusimicrobiaceae bacterium]
MIFFGIDIGGTFVKFLALNEKGKILKQDKFPTPLSLTAAKFSQFLSDIIKIWCKELKTKKAIIGIGIAGDTDPKKGILRFAPNIPWHNFKIAESIKNLTGFPTYVSNDANMAAFGIYQKELKNKYKNILVLTLGTGVGGGIIIDGKLYQGATGTAGEFGHIKISDNKNNLCACGAYGCVESFIGTKNLQKLTLNAIKENPKSIIADLLKEEEFSVKLLSVAAAKKDKSALEIWQYFGKHLGITLSNLTLIFNPEAIILSGGISGGAKYFMPSLQKVLKAQKIKEPFKHLKILTSKTKDIGAIGAALYALSMENEK